MTTPDDNDLDYLNNMDNSPEPEEVDEAPLEEEIVEDPAEEAEEAAEEAEEVEPKGEVAEADHGEEQPRRRSETRIQKLANERAQEKELRIRAEAERDALLKYRSAAPAPDNSESIRARNEKLSLMEPTERAVFLQAERIEQMNHQMMVSELRSEDRADKAAYDARATVDPRYARNKDSVEQELKDLRAKGINATREQCLVQVLGRKLLSEKPRKGAREAAAQRVASVKGKPTSARSTPAAPAGKGDGLSDLESRLKGKSFSSMFGN